MVRRFALAVALLTSLAAPASAGEFGKCKTENCPPYVKPLAPIGDVVFELCHGLQETCD
jgi:hypothetical protein